LTPAPRKSSAELDLHRRPIVGSSAARVERRVALTIQMLRVAFEERRIACEQLRRRAEDRIREELHDARAITIRGTRRIRG